MTVLKSKTEEGFGRKLYDEYYNTKECIYLADSSAGVKIYDITGTTTLQSGVIANYYTVSNNAVSATPFTLSNVLDVKGYVSHKQSTRLLAIATDDNGAYLINISNAMKDCTLVNNIYDTDILLPATKGVATSIAFRNDGTYMFIAQDGSIDRYNITTLNPDIISSTRTTFAPSGSASAIYTISLTNHDSELFAGTDSGIQLYSLDNANNLSYVSEYTSEGATLEYYPQLIQYQDFLIFTDGYKGLKVLKYDSNTNPMLCGVEYFYPPNNPTQLAKVNSVKMDEYGYLYVGIDSLGIVKFKFNDILFKHCK
jgi:hypothetical protein